MKPSLFIIFLSWHASLKAQEIGGPAGHFEQDSIAKDAAPVIEKGLATKPVYRKPHLVTTKGYRLRMIITRDRNKAIQLKGHLMYTFPSTKVYLTYRQPYFRVKMGNFKTTEEARLFKKKQLKDFRNVFIVRDNISYMWYPTI
jgi:hypothetical protein